MSSRTLFPGAMRKKKKGPQEHELLMGIYLQELKQHYFREYSFHDRRGWKFDFAVPGHMLAIEIEGGIWTAGRHSRGKGFQSDLEKYQEAAVLGWTLLRFSVEDVKVGRAKSIIAKWLERRISDLSKAYVRALQSVGRA